MTHAQIRFVFLNVGHFLDHFFVLIFATVAALRLTQEWGMSYAELIPYATPGMVAFGACAIPAGWIADKWSRTGMMTVFFVGIGICSVCTGLARNPFEVALSLTFVGVFAAIYHPVGVAMVVQGRSKTGLPLAINGVSGNLGVASAALITGFLIDTTGWRSAFYLPGILSIAVGLGYWWFERAGATRLPTGSNSSAVESGEDSAVSRTTMLRVFTVILVTTALGGLIFQSVTFSLPKVFDERLAGIAGTATLVGFYAFAVFAVAATAQLLVGYFVDNHAIRKVFAWVALLQFMLFAVMTQAVGFPALLTAFAFMLAVFGGILINDVLVARLVKTAWRSRAYALTYFVSFSASAAAVPVIASIHGKWGFDWLFGLLAILALLIFIAVMFLPRERAESPPVSTLSA